MAKSKFSDILPKGGKKNVAPKKPKQITKRVAKRSDPSFTQVTAYIPKALHQQVKVALIEREDDKEFSLLVEELLADWLKGKATN